MQNSIFFSRQTDPYYNLALEEMFFDAHAGGVLLYIWQNQNTVVIGKHQNAWKECHIALLEDEGGKLARRSSGGGAVFHDTGNLNFTFITRREEYDIEKQISVIQRAANMLGVKTAYTGRNDLIEQGGGAKFSGNAFRLGDRTALHHGTILVAVDMDKLGRYLVPSQEKLAAKGIASVRSRVVNLSDINGAITIRNTQDALVDAFIAIYGPAKLLGANAADTGKLQPLVEKYASWEWCKGRTPAFDITLQTRFDWGNLELRLSLREGHIRDAQVYSDAMDERIIERIRLALPGLAFRAGTLAAALYGLGHPHADMAAAWLQEKGF
ncbi:MAG: lipoate--protein ligase [Clostridiales bacterium]|jgi:lipoate-protein ligase A|nr:lipoate--protein ligase [Clostridiales bacterium]